MDLEGIHKKLREAAYFLHKMAEEERRLVGGNERFDFYLGALLSAGRSVDYRLLADETRRHAVARGHTFAG